MMLTLWLRRLLAAHAWRVLGAAAGVGLAVALIGTLGAFVSASSATLTQRAISAVPVDWQIQIAPGGDLRDVSRALSGGARAARRETVNYADVAGFSVAAGGTVQVTGAGQVVGMNATYRHSFPEVTRGLVGSDDGVLLTQQTASNLHARVGDSVHVVPIDSARASHAPALSAVVSGIVDMPSADSFFQAIGVSAARAPHAPPDDVLIVPNSVWHRWFAAQAGSHPSSVRTQLHVRLVRDLPHDPQAALTVVTDTANHVELLAGGAALIGDNLAAQLQGTREDALYARVIFLFLGMPGAALAAIVALVIITSGAERSRRDAARLRVRGGSAGDVALLAGVEAALVWIVATLFACALTAIATRMWVSGANSGVPAALLWTAAGAAAAAVIVIFAHLVPLATVSVAAADLKAIGRPSIPLWRRLYVDLGLLAVGTLFFLNTAASGYQVVLAPEGVQQSMVSYDAFVGPLLLWLGGGLLVRRLADAALSRRALLERAFLPLAGNLAGAVSAATSRQRRIVGRGLTVICLAVAFAVSTAVFNETYNAQSRVDAELTNGADVKVTLPSGSAGDGAVRALIALQESAGTDVMQHRFAYVGHDLQDLYAINPMAIGKATDMSDAFFDNHNARAALARLAARPEGVLVSAETVKDFQLHDGDRLNLRLQSGATGAYRPVAFTFVGVVREFPTAPRDSFLVANAPYVASATGVSGTRVVLMRAGAAGPAHLAASARAATAGVLGAAVSDIATAQQHVGSSLTAVDLRGLTGVELAFALLLLVGASALSLALGFAERRKNFAILAALGATRGQIGSFLWAEATVMVAGGAAAGIVLGFGVAAALVTVLTGVFDPPPEALAVPWVYLGLLAALALASTTLVVVGYSARRSLR